MQETKTSLNKVFAGDQTGVQELKNAAQQTSCGNKIARALCALAAAVAGFVAGFFSGVASGPMTIILSATAAAITYNRLRHTSLFKPAHEKQKTDLADAVSEYTAGHEA